MYNISALKQDLYAINHGTTNNKVVNINAMIYRAARQVLLDIDPQETIRIAEFVNPIMTNVYDYAIPTDLKGNKVIDIRPQVNRQPRDIFIQDYSQAFDIAKGNLFNFGDQFTMNFNSGVKTIRIDAPFVSTPVTLNQAESVTANGTWTNGGGATTPTANNSNFVAGAGSLQFNLSAGQATGYLENSTMIVVNLSNYLNQSTLFIYSYLPVAANFTSVDLRWGTDSSNYYHRTVTVNQQNNAFENGWNLLGFNWNGATVVGSPSASSIGYLRVTYTYNSTLQTAVLLNNITSNLGSIMDLVYYSKYMFRDSITGAFQETVTDDSNLINLDTESYNLLLDQTAYIAAQQLQGLDAQFFDANFWLQKYMEDKARYLAMYPSQLQKPQSVYYGMPNTKYSKYLGRGWQ